MFEKFTVIPAIDLKGGQVVRLIHGDMNRATVYGADPAETARRFEAAGAKLIHIVDLDGAIAGAPQNLEAIAKIRGAVKCAIDVSGGLRTIEAVRAAFASGADRVSIGSAALLNPELVRRACEEFPGKIFGSIDIRDGMLAVKGWVETSRLTVAEAAQRFRAAGVAAAIVTDIARDGAQAGVDAARMRRNRQTDPHPGDRVRRRRQPRRYPRSQDAIRFWSGRCCSRTRSLREKFQPGRGANRGSS